MGAKFKPQAGQWHFHLAFGFLGLALAQAAIIVIRPADWLLHLWILGGFLVFAANRWLAYKVARLIRLQHNLIERQAALLDLVMAERAALLAFADPEPCPDHVREPN